MIFVDSNLPGNQQFTREIMGLYSWNPKIYPWLSSRFEVGVHIADVTHFVHPDTAIDREAAERCTTATWWSLHRVTRDVRIPCPKKSKMSIGHLAYLWFALGLYTFCNLYVLHWIKILIFLMWAIHMFIPESSKGVESCAPKNHQKQISGGWDLIFLEGLDI